MRYTISQARTHLSRLIREAEAGEEVVVMRGTKPIVKLVAFRATARDPVFEALLHSAGEDPSHDEVSAGDSYSS